MKRLFDSLLAGLSAMMLQMRFIVILFLSVLTAFAQTAQEQRIINRHMSYDQAVRDTRTFINLLEDTHPDPYTAYGGRIEFRRKAQAILTGLPKEGLTVGDLAMRLNELILPLPGHTSLYLVRRILSENDPWLPIQFSMTADAPVLTATDLKEFEGLIGYRLAGVNGHTMEKIIQTMHHRDMRMENRMGDMRIASGVGTSRKFLLGYFPGDDPDQVIFQLQAPSGAIVERSVSWKERRWFQPDKCLFPQPPRWPSLPASDDPYFTKIFDQPKAAYLRVADIMGREAYEVAWRSKNDNVRDMLKRYYEQRHKTAPEDIAAALQGVPSFFDAATRLLTEMKQRQIPTLIIDLRGNGGGWTPSVYPVLALLYGDAFYRKDFPGQYITRQSALFLQKNNSTVDEWRLKNGNPLFEPGDYDFESANDFDPGPPEGRLAKALADYKQAGYSFAAALEALNGQPLYQPRNIVVLTDQGTYSAAFHFLYYLHHMGAKSVGVPPMQPPNAFMEVTEFTLPESKLDGSIANALQLFMPEDPKADTFPVTHPLTWEVFRRYGLDSETALRYALDLVAAGKL
jgi:hypothetical protein